MQTHQQLKEKQRAIRDGFPSELGLRIHRCLSWLNRAEQAHDDTDAQFIFLWIAFNAAYAAEIEETAQSSERFHFGAFFDKILQLDKDNRIYDAIWDRFPSSVRLFLNNQFVFQPFWKHHNSVEGYENWEERFQASQRATSYALSSMDTHTVLSTLFDRLYVLRNQLVHGGSTWNSGVNRNQLRDGSAILGFLVPIFVDLMMDHPNEHWGAPFYPVVN